MSWTFEAVQTVTTRIKEFVNDYFIVDQEDSKILIHEIDLAKRDWLNAHNYFQNVTDPDLIDHAIFMLEAAEAKYAYLLKRARNTIRT